jgi:hypothetical protein
MQSLIKNWIVLELMLLHQLFFYALCRRLSFVTLKFSAHFVVFLGHYSGACYLLRFFAE